MTADEVRVVQENDGPALLRELADEIETQRGLFRHAMLLLRNLTAAAPWECEVPGSAFWTCMRDAQGFVRDFDEKGNREC